MGASAERARLEGVTMKVDTIDYMHAFNAGQQINGTVEIDSDRDIPAYGIQVTLELKALTKHITTD